MIIPKAKKLTKAQRKEIDAIVGSFGCTVLEIVGVNRCVYAILGDETHKLMFNRILGLDYVSRVDLIESTHKLVGRKSALADHKVKVGAATVGLDGPFFMGGHCAVDPRNPNLYMETAEALKEAGVHALRGGVWKPRTNPYSYQGSVDAMTIAVEAKERTGLPLDVEVMDLEQLEIALDAGVDVLQIGTRNALNYSLLKEVGNRTAGTSTVVLLKRGRHIAPVDEFLAAAEYVVAGGNPNLLLCPRGTTPALDGYRNQPDESITPLIKGKSWLPVVVDPSHSVGHARYVPSCCLAAIAYGADGLCIEAHVEPSRGIGDDPKQAVTPEVFAEIISTCREIWPCRYEFK
ncbi:MAG: 3-deoxy-D-arabino-heptulosonate 7-phosphate synthase [Opitutae bacterium]|nr:3-deoxy-D-arabino-heptulosonate 7-phosphate synthase [Opitutae bacterium]